MSESDFLGDVCYDVTGNITSCKLFQPHISYSTLEKYYPLVCLANTMDIHEHESIIAYYRALVHWNEWSGSDHIVHLVSTKQ